VREADRRSKLGSVWLRPEPEATNSPRLSRDDIVRTAVRVLDRDGLDPFSMRLVASELGDAATSSLYWRIAGRNDLLELAVDQVLGEALGPADRREALTPTGRGDWREQVAQIVKATYHVFWEHTWAAQLLASHAGIGPNYLAISGRVEQILETAGFKGRYLDSAVSAIFHYLIGAAVTDSSWLAMMRRSGLRHRLWAREAGGTMGVDAAFLADYLDRDAQAGPERRFAGGLEVILIGLRPREITY
jgi:AcrR family transcriptional regulator